MIRSLEGKSPKVHPTAFISETAYIVGDVEIGENSNIWPGAVIRGDEGKIVIGRNVTVQDNSVVHGDADVYIGDNVTVAHGVICHAERIESNVLLGNGAVVNWGVHIGEYSLVGSGAAVVDGAKIPPRSLVLGVPARIVGQVQERHIALIQRVAQNYVRKGQRYKKEGNLEASSYMR